MTPLERFRRDKDRYLQTDTNSPFYSAAFAGLSYYAESESYTVVSTFERAESRKTVLLGTSSGDEQPYFRVGQETFELAAQPCALNLYQPTFETDDTRFFVPFKDATSGADYGAGRYLEATLLPDEYVLLDFNRAYQPLCAYSERYHCPLPPAENTLSVPIYAGEKL